MECSSPRCPSRNAQRRPGFEPRRHRRRRSSLASLSRRSTKAGVRTSATLISRRALILSFDFAQRRPGFEPRRHRVRSFPSPPAANAQRRPGFEPRRHRLKTVSVPVAPFPLNEGRGSNLGDTRAARPSRRHAIPLNEGRGSNLGDTALALLGRRQALLRSTKAEVRTSATLSAPVASASRVSMPRSTKAEVRTSATPWALPSANLTVNVVAQRRPRFEPRRHLSQTMLCVLSKSGAQRRPRFEPRRHLSQTMLCVLSKSGAQRRPRFEPRRHC